MGIEISTAGDILKLALALGFTLISISISVVLLRVFALLGKIKNIVSKIEEITTMVENFLFRPLLLAMKIWKRVEKFFQDKI